MIVKGASAISIQAALLVSRTITLIIQSAAVLRTISRQFSGWT